MSQLGAITNKELWQESRASFTIDGWLNLHQKTKDFVNHARKERIEQENQNESALKNQAITSGWPQWEWLKSRLKTHVSDTEFKGPRSGIIESVTAQVDSCTGPWWRTCINHSKAAFSNRFGTHNAYNQQPRQIPPLYENKNRLVCPSGVKAMKMHAIALRCTTWDKAFASLSDKIHEFGMAERRCCNN